MRILIYNMKRILNGKLNLILFIVPIIAISIFLLAFNASSKNDTDKKVFSDCKVGIVDLDKTKYTQQLTEYLKSKYSVKLLKENEINQNLIKNKINYAIVLNEGLTSDLRQGKTVDIKGISLIDGVMFTFFNEDLNHHLRIAKAAGIITKDEDEFYSYLNNIENGQFKVEINKVVIDEAKTDVSKAVSTFFGFLVLFLILFNCNMGERLLDDKLNNKIKRISTTAYSYGKYISSVIASQILLGLVQVSIIFAILHLVGNDQIKGLVGLNILAILILANIIGLAIGILIATVAKTKSMFLAILNIVTNITAMLGGLYWPLDIMPKFVTDNISVLVPTYWLRTAMNMSLKGDAVSKYFGNLIIVILFAVGIIALSILAEKYGRKLVKRGKVINEN